MKRLDDGAIAAALPRLPGWSVVGDCLIMRTTHATFEDAIAFVVGVADVAARLDHHPDILIEYRAVTLTLTTHDVGGLSDRDLDTAVAINALPRGPVV